MLGDSQIYNKNNLRLSGGEALFVSPEKYRITYITHVENQNNYLNSNEYWSSNIYNVEILKNHCCPIIINPKSNEEGYIGEWEIK